MQRRMACIVTGTFLAAVLVHLANGRGMLIEPPQRSSVWRFHYNVTVNLDDDMLNCGGYEVQYIRNGGRCGVCGDPWHQAKENEDGGRYANEVVVRTYEPGGFINITVQTYNNLLGYFEFRLCARNSTTTRLSQFCFDTYLLWIDEAQGTRYYVGSRGGIHDMHVRLPIGVFCTRCVLQWKFNTGYRMSLDNACPCLGCGKQEQLYNCADVAILAQVTNMQDDYHESLHNSNHHNHNVHNTNHDHHNVHNNNHDNHNVHNNNHVRHNEHLDIRPSRPGREKDTGISSLKPSYKIPFETKTKQLQLSSTKVVSPASAIAIAVTKADPVPIIAHKHSSIPVQPEINIIPDAHVTSGLSTASVTEHIERRSSHVTTYSPPDTTPAHNIKQVTNVRVFFTVPSVGEKTLTTQPSFLRHFSTARPSRAKWRHPSTVRRRVKFKRPPPIKPRFSRKPAYSSLSLMCDTNSDEFKCKGTGAYQNLKGASEWCTTNCRLNNCYPKMCTCWCEETIQRAVFKIDRGEGKKCHAIGAYSGIIGMDQWCRLNCHARHCPKSMCNIDECRNGDL